MKKKIKICFVASSGGHLEEISCLKSLSEKYDSFIVTEKTDFEVDLFSPNVYFVRQINRHEKRFLLHLIKLFVQSKKIFLKESPDCVISTGALATVPMCIIAKLKKKKVIYIESFARVYNASFTGKIMYHIADKFYVQWPDMLDVYKKSEYVGGIF